MRNWKYSSLNVSPRLVIYGDMNYTWILTYSFRLTDGYNMHSNGVVDSSTFPKLCQQSYVSIMTYSKHPEILTQWTLTCMNSQRQFMMLLLVNCFEKFASSFIEAHRSKCCKLTATILRNDNVIVIITNYVFLYYFPLYSGLVYAWVYLQYHLLTKSACTKQMVPIYLSYQSQHAVITNLVSTSLRHWDICWLYIKRRVLISSWQNMDK